MKLGGSLERASLENGGAIGQEADIKWTAESVEAFMVEAVWTLERLPDQEHNWLMVRAMWPAHKTLYADDDQRNPDALARRQAPSARAVSRYEAVLNWLRLVPDPADRRIVFVACLTRCGEPRYWQTGRARNYFDWDDVRAKICRNTGSQEKRDNATLSRYYRGAIELIAAKLERERVKE